jgi:hypothetical protein
MAPAVTTQAPPEPTSSDLDAIVEQLKSSWTSKITVRRQSKDDVGIREIYVSLDGERVAVLHDGQEITCEVTPGPHRLRVHNTLFWKTLDFSVTVGEHVSFVAINRTGFGTYSILAYFIGTNVVYLSVEREQYYGARK